MASYPELPTFLRPAAGNAPPRRRCLASPLFLFCLLPATIMLGKRYPFPMNTFMQSSELSAELTEHLQLTCMLNPVRDVCSGSCTFVCMCCISAGVFLLMGAPSLSRQPSAPAAPPLQSSSFSGVHVAAQIAAAAVLPQARPLRADKQSRGAVLPAKHNSTAAAPDSSASTGATGSAKSYAEPAHKQQQISDASAADPDLKAANVTELSSDTDARRLTGGAQQFSNLSADNNNSISTTAERMSASTSAAADSNSTATNSSNNGGSSGSTMSVQDADIAAILAAAAEGEAPLNMAACLQENDTERPFTVQEFLEAQPAR